MPGIRRVGSTRTCSSWRFHTESPPGRRSTRCSTTGSRLRRSGTASRRSLPANSEISFFFFFCCRLLLCCAAAFSRLDTNKLEKRRIEGRRYLAFKTKAAFKQRVLNINVSGATRQAKIWRGECLNNCS